MSGTPAPGHVSEAAGAVRREVGDVAYAVALASLPGMGPATLRQLLSVAPARSCWEQLCSGALAPSLLGGRRRAADRRAALERWRAAARLVRPEEGLASAEASGIAVHILGDRSYPGVLAEEPTAPAVLFTLGGRCGLGSDDAPRVAVVGTRSSTHYGDEVAAELGAGLAAGGVTVVSGLATGIDAAAHEGALVHADRAAPLAIVGGGVDVVYPQSNRRLRARLVEAGTLLAEAAPGAPPERWRFPLRNRLVAAAVDVVVVVEAHASGGAMHTVDAALARGVPVAAVPGSVRSSASKGTNALVADGAAMVRDVDDVLALLALRRAGRPQPPSCHGLVRAAGAGGDRGRAISGVTGTPSRPAGGRDGAPVEPGSPAHRVLGALDDSVSSLEVVLRRTGLAIGEASVALDELVRTGQVHRGPGGYERSTGSA